MDLFEFSRELTKLKQAGKHDEVLKHFRAHKTNFNNDQIKGNSYVVSAVLTSLRKTGNAEHVPGFLRTYNIQLDSKTDQWVLGAAAWGLRAAVESIVGTSEEDEEELEEPLISDVTANLVDMCEQIQIVVPLLLSRADDFSQMTAARCMDAVKRAAISRGAGYWQMLVDLTDSFQPDTLSSSPQQSTQGEKTTELASNLETWYAARARALFETGAYPECVACVGAAQNAIDRFHYGNDVWLPRLRARARVHLGERQRGIEELKALLARKPDWFIMRDIASALAKDGKHEEAIKFACQAMAARRANESKKVGVLQLLAECLETVGKKDFASKHAALLLLIRQENRWGISDELHAMVGRLCAERPASSQRAELLGQLRKFWAQHDSGTEESDKKGEITKILHSNERGVDGFLRCTAGSDFYFKVGPGHPLASRLSEGVMVLFQAASPGDGRKRPRARIRSLC